MDMSDFQQDAEESFGAETLKNPSWDFNRANARGKSGTVSALLRFLHSHLERSRRLWQQDLHSVSKMSICGSALPRIVYVGGFLLASPRSDHLIVNARAPPSYGGDHQHAKCVVSAECRSSGGPEYFAADRTILGPAIQK
ncbi:hypothetical protein [Bradyrhizobium sp. SZCCHNR2032]|uniref:hypothetical protein n=1 Tax=Bradyrhizobium sp. SZCCHNR2032 TaxID=3057384 RepID=UPI002916A995|nr:hypothetical protein [Bradyrhizobium sp. SZCCHNR2032]